MATSTLIQYLETERFGSLPGDPAEAVPVSAMDRRQTETFLASAAIAAGDVVSLDNTKSADGDKAIFVLPADGNALPTPFICPVGVALAAAAEGEKVEVCVRGVCEASVSAGPALGAVLTFGNTSGVLQAVAAATEPQVAIALEASAGPGATTTVYVRGAF